MNPYLQDADFTLWNGDSLAVLRTLPDESVDCCITSPPYWGLRDYGTGSWEGGEPQFGMCPACDGDTTDGLGGPCGMCRGSGKVEIGCRHSVGGQVQDNKAPGAITTGQRPGVDASTCRKCGATRIDSQLGLEPTPDEYVTRMVEVFREVRRVLARHGTCWVNMGDSYASGNRGYYDDDRINGFARAGTHRRTTSGPLKPKDLCGIPWRLAFALQADGWYLRSDIIWSKPNPMPESVTDRPTKAHEMVFLLAKGPWIGREPGPIESRLSREDARWLALLLDTEGNVSIKHTEREGKSDWYGAQIAVGSTSRPLLERLRAIVGAGSIGERKGKNAPMFYWQVSNKVAQDLLYALHPHLIVKQRQAAIAIYLETLLYHRGHPKGRTDRENAVLESLWKRNKECNQFGTPDLSDVPAPKYGKWGPARYFFDQEAVREPHNHDGRTVTAVVGQNGSIQHRDGERWPNSGRNIRSVWEIATQSYPEAHYATFPEELVRRCLLAGCPEQVCGECGKARTRIVSAEYDAEGRTTNGPRSLKQRHETAGFPVRRVKTTSTEGFTDCGHNAYRPGIVLDPFMGSGTTALVARKHGRRAVGIELSEDYCKLAAKRTAQLGLFSEVA